jgi:hypothetical protein
MLNNFLNEVKKSIQATPSLLLSNKAVLFMASIAGLGIYGKLFNFFSINLYNISFFIEKGYKKYMETIYPTASMSERMYQIGERVKKDVKK